jgi:hypothetical protein
MRTFFRTTAVGLLLTAAVLTGVPAAAYAAGPCQTVSQQNGASYGLLNNIQLGVPISLGLDITRNALGLLGSASTTSTGGDTLTC